MTEMNFPQYQGNLMIVDDFELNRDMFGRRLEVRGFSVHKAESARRAIEIMDSGCALDLILLDIMMPDMDGFQLLEFIRSRYSPSELIVFMVTAKDDSQDIVRALALGANDYITKPIDFAVVVARINNHLARKRAEQALRDSEERYALAARGANDGLWDWDLRENQIFFSDRWKTMLGYAPEEIGSSPDEWFERVHPDDKPRLKGELRRQCKGDSENLYLEHRMLTREGNWRWMVTRGLVVFDREHQATRMVGWQMDTSQRVDHDRLTALPNRGLFLDRLRWAITKAQREEVEAFALLYIGLDRFKLVNESLGHERGDQILQLVAARIQKLIRPQDTLARMGGDEFALLVEHIEGLGSVTHMAECLKEGMTQTFDLHGEEVHITVSIGIVLGEPDAENTELLRRAHRTMEVAKDQGKNTYVFYEESMDAKQLYHLKLESRLRRAIEKNELFLVYQPQIETRSGRMVGVEALLRWRNGDRGIVPPSEFIPVAENSGLIEPIGDWVIHEACRQNKAWQDAGLDPIRVAVNLSSKQFRNGERLYGVVEAALAQTGLAAGHLELELTESLLMINVTEGRELLTRFHQLGTHLSLDDFGTGYSSLSYLKKFPIDSLKIDQSFVRDIDSDADDAAICTAVIGMAHSLRMSVIAEGVETHRHLQFLKTLDCDYMQGYHFSKPVAPEQIAELLAARKCFIGSDQPTAAAT